MDTEKSSTVSSTLKTFCQRSTVHGLSIAVHSENRPTSIIWFIIVFAGAVRMAFHLYHIVSAYLEYKTTEYLYEDVDGYDFPDVTICNLNGISYTNLQKAADTNTNVQNVVSSFELRRNVSGEILKNSRLFWGLGEKASELGHSFEDFIIICEFGGKPCKKDDFVFVQPENFFNCYTFTQRNYPKTTKEAIGRGLILILYTEPMPPRFQKPYDQRTIHSNSQGVRVVLSAQNTLSLVMAQGYDILPGHCTSLRFDIVEHMRLPQPYSPCRNIENWSLHKNFKYTFAECRNLCIHQYVISKCGCFPTAYDTKVNYTTKNIFSCGHYLFSNESLDTEMMQCERHILKEVHTEWNFEKECDCQLPCLETKYPLTISQSIWPSYNSMDSFIDFIKALNTGGNLYKDYYLKLTKQNASREVKYRWIRKNFLKLIVFADTKTVSVKEQISMCTLIDLLCQIGGCLGLWLGISIVTCAEFLHLFFSLLRSIASPSMVVPDYKKEVAKFQTYNRR